MALLFMDSMDHYVTADILEKYNQMAAMTISAGNGRRGSASLRATITGSYALRGLSPSGTTAIMGGAVRLTSLSSLPRIMGFYDGSIGRDQSMLRVNADGGFSVYRGGTSAADPGSISATPVVIGTGGGGFILANTFAYVEYKVTFHASAGSVEVRVNGVTALTLSGVNTATVGSVAWTGAWVGMNVTSTTVDHDDLYVLDGSGAAPWNNFLGDCRVDALLPTGAGATTGWTPNTGANWAAVDDAAPDDDTTYTSASATALTDTFVVQDAPVVGAALFGVQHCLSTKKTDSGAASIAPVVRHSGVDYPGTNLNPGLTYAVLQQIQMVNPGTGVAWTEAGFNAAEFGYTRTV